MVAFFLQLLNSVSQPNPANVGLSTRPHGLGNRFHEPTQAYWILLGLTRIKS